MYKKLSMILFIIWSISVVLILTFGTQVAGMISNSVSEVIHTEQNKLKDVTINKTQIPIEQLIELDVTLSPDTFSSSDIIYTSLNPELFDIRNNHYIVGKTFDGEQKSGTLLITNRLDDKFKKEVEITFYKTYPTDIKLEFLDENRLSKEDNEVYIKIPFFIETNFTPDKDDISEKEIECIFNEEYFNCNIIEETIELIPKYEDYDLNDDFSPISSTVKVLVNGNEIKSYDLTINPIQQCNSFDQIKIYKIGEGLLESRNDIFVKDEMSLILYSENKKLTTNFTIKSNNEDICQITEDNKIKCLKTGTVTLEVSLLNGYKEELNLVIRNKLGLPTYSGVNFNDNNEIIIKQETDNQLFFKFADDVSFDKITYTIDSGISHEYNEELNSITLTGNKKGSYNLVVTIDDGMEEPIVLNLVIKVIENERSFSSIISKFSRFLAKILGHMSFFVLEAILAFFMMFYYKGKNKWINALIYFGIGLFLASLTEFIQLFIPGRSGTFKDVMIDMSGYIIGFIISILLFKIIQKIKNKKKEKSHVVNCS